MIKVLFVAHSGSMSGGANRTLLSVILMLRDQYHLSPSVLVPQDDSADFRTECEKCGIPVYEGRYHSCCTVFRRNVRDLLRAMKLIAAPVLDWCESRKTQQNLPSDFDLVYTNDRMVIAGAYLAKRLAIPHIWHIRAFGKEVHTSYPPYWNHLIGFFSNHVVAISKAIHDSFRGSVPAGKLVLIHNGLDPNSYLPADKVPHASYHILLTGHLVAHKGQMEALQALDILINRHHIDAQIFLAGVKPAYASSRYVQGLEVFIQAHGLTPHVHFLGQVSDMNALRSQMDVELECCWCEPFGRVTVEAMLSGIPVVASRAGGTLDIIEDNQSGLLYELGKPEELAEKLLWLYQHPDTASQIAQNAHAHAMKHFTLQHSVSNIYKLIMNTVVEAKHA